MSKDAQSGFYQRLPPSDDGKQVVQTAATGAAAANVALWTGLPAADRPKGFVWVTFECVSNDCYLRFKETATAAATTTANGLKLPSGSRIDLWIPTHVLSTLDVIAAGVGSIKWYVSSPDSYRTNGITGA
jgi:hypothetical protein